MNEPQKTNQTVFFVPSAQPIAPANIDTSGVPSGQLDCRAAGQQQVVCSSDEWEKPLQVTITFTPARANGS
jgi:hypothetical protein